MNPRLKSALLWGGVGALAFLVLIQGYELWSGNGVDAAIKVVVALLVGVTSTVGTYVAEGRFARRGTVETGEDN